MTATIGRVAAFLLGLVIYAPWNQWTQATVAAVALLLLNTPTTQRVIFDWVRDRWVHVSRRNLRDLETEWTIESGWER